MAFPSSTSSKEGLGRALEKVRATASGVKQLAQDLRSATEAGPVTGRRIVQAMEEFTAAYERFESIKTVPGLAEYAKAQFADQGLNIAAEFASMQTALLACITWISTNIPKDASKRWLAIEEIVAGKRVERVFSTSETLGLRNVLDTLRATID